MVRTSARCSRSTAGRSRPAVQRGSTPAPCSPASLDFLPAHPERSPAPGRSADAIALRRLAAQVRAALLLLLAAASLPGAAHAQISASVAAVSDYRFRGISQSDRKPALQGSVAYDHPSGLFAGLFVS